ncbi:MAG: methyltransferase domain-containing protein [Crocinitomicaceae bacterium]|nr:methyltransferase domain-containing protein [Crocinitomicaceae bacterium]
MKEFNADEELSFLNRVVKDYADLSPYSKIKKEIILKNITDRIKNKEGNALQFGCANGLETSLLAVSVGQLDLVDGSSEFIEKVRAENTLPNVHFFFSLFEDFNFETVKKKYDYITCNYVLEHVYDSSLILQNMHSLMHKNSLLFITVPNSNALSRKIALEMGLLESLEALTENDHKHGHRRTYTMDSISAEAENAGFEIVEKEGIILKILADFQLNKLLKEGTLTEKHIQALNRMAQHENFSPLADSAFLVLKAKHNQ